VYPILVKSISISIRLIQGGTPSPSVSHVTVEGESTDWLVAPRVVHTVPCSIVNGATTRIDGIFTYRVKRPKESPGRLPLVVEDAFILRGHISGINRVIPEFHRPRKITLQHPVAMDAPKYLRCLTIGQEAIFSWNVSHHLEIPDHRLKIKAT
jgi:hypothetical protein